MSEHQYVMELQWLFRSPECGLLVFHEGLSIIPQLAATGILDRAHVYFTFSWCLNYGTLEEIRHLLGEAQRYRSREQVLGALTFLINSGEELEHFQVALPGVDKLLFSEPSFLNEDIFHARDDASSPLFEAVYNARPMLFKRHYLTEQIQNKLFVTYDLKDREVDLTAFNPDAVVSELSEEAVPEYLRKAHVGLLLSAQEGACYSSLEYLLCGLPVVSTPSQGGRSEFYDERNSIVCEAEPLSVALAVREAISRLASGSFVPREIRRSALCRMNHFRQELAAHMYRALHARGTETNTELLLQKRIANTNKLRKYRSPRYRKLV